MENILPVQYWGTEWSMLDVFCQKKNRLVLKCNLHVTGCAIIAMLKSDGIVLSSVMNVILFQLSGLQNSAVSQMISKYRTGVGFCVYIFGGNTWITALLY